MIVVVEFSGAGRPITGQKTLELDLPEGTTYRQILKILAVRYPGLVGVVIAEGGEAFLSSTMFSRNGEELIMPEMIALSPTDGDRLMIVSLITGGCR